MEAVRGHTHSRICRPRAGRERSHSCRSRDKIFQDLNTLLDLTLVLGSLLWLQGFPGPTIFRTFGDWDLQFLFSGSITDFLPLFSFSSPFPLFPLLFLPFSFFLLPALDAHEPLICFLSYLAAGFLVAVCLLTFLRPAAIASVLLCCHHSYNFL